MSPLLKLDPMTSTWSVYLLQSLLPVVRGKRQLRTYVGQTGRSVWTRLSEHNKGKGGRTTRWMRPLRVFAYIGDVKDQATAVRLEKAVKKQRLSAKEGRGLTSQIHKKYGAMVKALSHEVWRDQALTLHLLHPVPEVPIPDHVTVVFDDA
jgi:predicted GIY-YIG superfamily endonuclease